jgi:hypothetical protein
MKVNRRFERTYRLNFLGRRQSVKKTARITSGCCLLDGLPFNPEDGGYRRFIFTGLNNVPFQKTNIFLATALRLSNTILTELIVCCLVHADISMSMLLRNVGRFSPNFTASYPRISTSSLKTILIIYIAMGDGPRNGKARLCGTSKFFLLCHVQCARISGNQCPGGMRKTMEILAQKHETWVATGSLSNFISKSRALSTCVSRFRLGDQTSVPPKA